MPLGFGGPHLGKFVRRVRRGCSPGDGVLVPGSPVYLLTRPNRMTVSLGTRAGTTSTHRTYCPFRSLQRTRSADRARKIRGVE